MNARRSRRMIPRSSRLLAHSAVAMGALLLTSCSIPVGGEIETLDTAEYADIVSGLDTTTTTQPLPEEGTQIRLYFISDGGLVQVFRPFVSEPNIAEILTALQEGPTEEEMADDPSLRTELPAGLNPVPQGRDAGEETIIVDVSDEGGLQSLFNENPVKAEYVVTQLVCTLTTLNLLSGIPITGVEFYDSQGRIPIVDANSTSIEGPARASDFNDCVTQAELDALAEEAEAEDNGSTTTTGG